MELHKLFYPATLKHQQKQEITWLTEFDIKSSSTAEEALRLELQDLLGDDDLELGWEVEGCDAIEAIIRELVSNLFSLKTAIAKILHPI